MARNCGCPAPKVLKEADHVSDRIHDIPRGDADSSETTTPTYAARIASRCRSRLVRVRSGISDSFRHLLRRHGRDSGRTDDEYSDEQYETNDGAHTRRRVLPRHLIPQSLRRHKPLLQVCMMAAAAEVGRQAVRILFKVCISIRR